MRFLVLWIGIAWLSPCYATMSNHKCFVSHLSEAIRLNLDRREVYAEQSQGESRRISNLLIWSERLTLLSGQWFDLKAARWQEHGIPLMCSDFVSMDLTPQLQEVDDSDRQESRLTVDVSKLRDSLKAGLVHGYEHLFAEAYSALQEIASEPHYHCMVRHLLESIGRSAKLAPIYERMATEKGLDSPAKLIHQFLRLQIWGLKLGKWLDKQALPLQRKGLGIICNDVPPIPMNIGIDPPLILESSNYP